VIIVMQGRVRSTRLPGKGFFTFFGQTIWERMCDIACEVRGVREVVFATGDLPENHLIRPLVEARGVRFFAGSEDNVLERFCSALEGADDDYLVRITCDNYLIQPDVIEGLVKAVRAADADYGYIKPLSHFAGEVVRIRTLRECVAGGLYSELAREHVTWDIRRSEGTRKTALPPDFLGLDHVNGVTLDTVEDLILMKRLEATLSGLRPVRCLEALKHLAGSGQ
jgi:spore coat polysaccharide biosynthesis protein SpsF